jgi:hypothetical protein
MSSSYLYQCYYEACSILISSLPFEERLKSARSSLRKLSISGIPKEFTESTSEIYKRIEQFESMTLYEQDQLAKDILHLFAKICGTTEASQWV